MSASPSTPTSSAHARTGSRSSVTAGPSEISSSGTAAPSSPASATKTGAFSRAASIAKRNSLQAQGANGRPRSGTGNNAKESPAANAMLKPRRQNSVSMARNGSSSSSSANEATLEDAPGDTDDLSRMTREQLIALTKRERTEHEELEARLATLTAEHSSLSSAHAELQSQSKLQDTRLNESHATASRLESELAEHTEAQDGLRTQLKTAEKESKDAQKRYTEQVETFEAERQSWQYSRNTLQHKLEKLQEEYEAVRAQASAKEAGAGEASATGVEASSAALSPSISSQSAPQGQLSPNFQIPISTLEELQDLHARVNELVQEQEAMKAESQGLREEMEDLQRVNGDLQEENENLLQLLNERMFAGVINDSGIGSSADSSHATNIESIASDGSRSRPASSLDALPEEFEGEDDSFDRQSLGVRQSRDFFEASGSGSLADGAVPANIAADRTGRVAKKRDSLLGGGLDLEAELDRARNEEEEARREAEKEQERKKAIAARRKANQSSHLGGREGDPLPTGIEALQKEVKQLRQENKGLSTYVTKLIERVISIDGFEKVLSSDLNKASPAMAPTSSDQGGLAPPSSAKGAPGPRPALPPRPSSTMSAASTPGPLSPSAAAPAPAPKKNRMSMDWIASALWKGSSSSTPSSSTPANAPAPGLKPMKLATAAAPATRRMSIEEDEDDARTRARLQSEMKLLGLDNHGSPVLHTSSAAGKAVRTPSGGLSPRPPSTGFSPRPPSVPPKDEGAAAREASMRQELESGRASGFTEMSGVSPDTVKVRGHRKRPSATNRESIIGSAAASSVGLGLSYSKDSTSTWSAGSPSAASLAGGDDFRSDKRSSGSQPDQ